MSCEFSYKEVKTYKNLELLNTMFFVFSIISCDLMRQRLLSLVKVSNLSNKSEILDLGVSCVTIVVKVCGYTTFKRLHKFKLIIDNLNLVKPTMYIRIHVNTQIRPTNCLQIRGLHILSLEYNLNLISNFLLGMPLWMGYKLAKNTIRVYYGLRRIRVQTQN